MAIDKDAVRAANRLEDVIPELTGEPLSRHSGRESLTRCPFHEDAHPSLCVNVDKQVWRCHVCQVGGDVFAFVQRHQNLPFAEALVWLGARMGISNQNGNGNGHKATATPRVTRGHEREHLYVDEHGTPLFKVVIGGRRPDGKKIVWQEQPDGHGGWVKHTRGARRLLYRLSDVQGKTAIVVAEGEKDVDRLWAIGIPATCNVGGAGNWTDGDSAQLQAAGVLRVRVIGDHDEPGRRHNAVVARSCAAHQIDARPVNLPNVPEKGGDVSDFLDAHETTGKADLEALLRAAPPWVDLEPVVSDRDDEEVDALPLTDLSWPAPLSRAAYVGIVGEIVDTLAPQTEADPVAILLQLLAMFGSVIGRTAHFRVEADTHHLTLYEVLVGKTSKGRKGVSEGQARRFFGAIDPTWTTDCQASGLSTGEGLIAAIRDAIEKLQPIRENKRIVGYEPVIEDHGISDKRLYVTESEFASTLKVMMREGNTLSPVLRNAWDGKTLRTLTKGSPLKATAPHVTISASITKDEVRRYLDATESANGFGNRFLWACVRRSQFLPDGGDFVPVEALIARLQTLVASARQVGEMRHDREARALWHRVYPHLSAERPGLLGSLTARAEPQVRRLACLYALGDGSPVVRTPHLEAALEVWRYCFDSAAYIFGDALGHPQADALLMALKAAGPTGLTRSDIINGVFQKNLSATELSRAVAVLQDASLAVCRQEDSRGGRRAQRWFYARQTYGKNGESAPEGGDGGTLSVKSVGPFTQSIECAPPVAPEGDAVGHIADGLFPARQVADGPLVPMSDNGEEFDL